MGDGKDPPTIKASASFSGNGPLIEGRDPATHNKGEDSFATGIKNLILDTTETGGRVSALDWSVAQACQTQNVMIRMPQGKGTGVTMSRGSTVGVSDLTIHGGENGILVEGHQQVVFTNIHFKEVTNAVNYTGGQSVNVIGSTFDTCGRAVSSNGAGGYVGIVDSTLINSGDVYEGFKGKTNFALENLSVRGGNGPLATFGAHEAIQRQHAVGSETNGNTYSSGGGFSRVVRGNSTLSRAIAPNGHLPVVAAPNYANLTAENVINVKDQQQNGGVKVSGDQTTDDAEALNKVLAHAAQNHKIAFFPFGIYRVGSTVTIPDGSRVVGEAWSTISGFGQAFSNAGKPTPVVRVGTERDSSAHIEIQDMRFTVEDVLPGAVIVEVNAAGATPGAVGIWNSLVTVGGTADSKGINEKCTNSGQQCQAAYLGIHLTNSSSAYLQNNWAWVADHQTEGQGGTAISGKGGVLIESNKGTWIYGLGSEHWWLFQTNVHRASNVVISMLQTETNYNQGSAAIQTPPTPWEPNSQAGDPSFDWCNGDKGCAMGLSLYATDARDLFLFGQAAWVFFDGPNYHSCQGDCQQTLTMLDGEEPSNVNMYGLGLRATTNVLRLKEKQVGTRQGYKGGWGGLMVRFNGNGQPQGQPQGQP